MSVAYDPVHWNTIQEMKQVILFLAVEGESGAVSNIFRNYKLYTGPAKKLTFLGTMDGDSVIECAWKCTIMDVEL